MIILSLSLRGFGSPTKLASLKSLFSKIKPDVVFLQETLVSSDKAKALFLKCLPHRSVVAVDSLGHSGGLLTSWNPDVADFQAFGISVGIFIEGKLLFSSTSFKLLNCYAPYSNHEAFWQKLFDSGILHEDNLILGGDLNFILSTHEVWGTSARIDPKAVFFYSIFHRAGLIDLHPSMSSPTWRNGKIGANGIAKRLDRFLLDSKLIGDRLHFRSWVEPSTISNHHPICLSIEGPPRLTAAPFKFNCSWIGDLGFNSLVKNT